MTRKKLFYLIHLLSLLICPPAIVSAQENATLGCSDIKNGTFTYFDPREGVLETYIRKGDIQREIIPKRRETIYWEVNWLNDCTYTLKYQSGAEDRAAAEQKLFGKHLIVTQILDVTEDYVTFRTSLDKPSNPTVLNDTLWIKQRQSLKSKMVTNPRADSIAASKRQTLDSTVASYATLYIYRPAKILCWSDSYDLLINGSKAFVITNGCRYVLKLLKPGMYNVTAKLRGPDQTVMIDVKPGGAYYVRCTATWGLNTHKEVHLMRNEEGAAEFNSKEKEN